MLLQGPLFLFFTNAYLGNYARHSNNIFSPPVYSSNLSVPVLGHASDPHFNLALGAFLLTDCLTA